VRDLSETESTTNGQSEEETQEEEEIEEEEESPRLKKMVDRLLKEASRHRNFKKDKLAGKSLEEQYDILEFYVDNMPRLKNKNKPPIGKPITEGRKEIEGISIKEHPQTGRKSYVIDPEKLFKNKK
jgi:hypothetical protein